MKKIKTFLVMMMVFTLAFGFTACGSSPQKETPNAPAEESKADSAETTPATESASGVAEPEVSSETVSVDAVILGFYRNPDSADL